MIELIKFNWIYTKLPCNNGLKTKKSMSLEHTETPWDNPVRIVKGNATIGGPFTLKELKQALKNGQSGMKRSEILKKIRALEKKRTYKVLIIPSSDDEPKFEECGNFREAVQMMRKNKSIYSAEVLTFKSTRERAAFLRGYQAGCGYMGDGLYYTN